MSSTWKIKFTPKASKQLSKLNKDIQQRILDYFKKRLLKREDPRELGKQLAGSLSELWRYRIGDYRVICEIQNNELLILIVRVGDRKKVY